ncbi:MAG: hypothetical protein EU532_09595 [Promethearchaeota archaeon]|nr:MAG: hypothetical protein EU532_09595 [Candidatus Lokiarchaeota archaeon]
MELSPERIYKDYTDKNLAKDSAVAHLISIIENSETATIRIKSIEYLESIGSKDNVIFTHLENLLVSDSNENVRNIAAKTIRSLFIDKALEPMIWAYQHETSINCLVTIISTLGEINNPKAQSFLLNIIKKIENHHFKKSYSQTFKNNNIRNHSNKFLAELINNFIVVKYFEDKFSNLSYVIHNGYVIELDLSCISSNIFGLYVLKNLPEFISVLKHLRKLDLKINRITTLPKSIGDTSSLKYLDLSNNIIKRLPHSIGSLRFLEFLYLRYNNLINIPNSIGQLKNLRIFDLRHNKLTSLPHSIRDLTCLEVLDLHGNQIQELPNCLKNLTSLLKLELGLNKLRFLPEWIKNFHSLKKLGLGGNKLLNNLPEWIAALSSLKELELYDNNLKQLPESIGSLSFLEILTLRNNQLMTLPKSFKNLTSLKKLNLSWNNFTTLPEWIDSLTSLEELNLWGNKLKTLPDSIGSLSSLKILNLNFNKYISELPESIKILQNNGLVIYK